MDLNIYTLDLQCQNVYVSISDETSVHWKARAHLDKSGDTFSPGDVGSTSSGGHPLEHLNGLPVRLP